jgi:hypothetical protein
MTQPALAAVLWLAIRALAPGRAPWLGLILGGDQ